MWYKIKNQAVELCVYVKPNAKKSALVGWNETQGLIISLHAPAREMKANIELISFLSQFLTIPKSHISLMGGEHSRMKRILLPLNDKLQKLLAKPDDFF